MALKDIWSPKNTLMLNFVIHYIHLFGKLLVNAYYVPNAVLGIRTVL